MFKKTLLLSLFFLLISVVKSYALPYSVNQCFDHLSAQSFKAARVWGIRAVNNHPQSFYAHLCLGEADVHLGLYNPAIYDFKHAIPFANDKNRLELVYNWIGDTFGSVGNEKDALMYDFRSLKLARELNDTSGESSDINNIALIYQNEGNDKKALHYLKKSLALSRTKKGKAEAYSNIGMFYAGTFNYMSNYTKAIKYETKALNLNESIGDYYGAAIDYLDLGYSYIDVKNYPTAKRYILKAISMEKKIGNKKLIGIGYRNIGMIFNDERDNKKAFLYYHKAYDMFKVIGDTSDMHDCLLLINGVCLLQTKIPHYCKWINKQQNKR